MGLPSSQLDHPLFITYMLLFELKCTVHYIHATMGTTITCTKHYMLLFALHCTVHNLQCTEHNLGALHWEERFAPVQKVRHFIFRRFNALLLSIQLQYSGTVQSSFARKCDHLVFTSGLLSNVCLSIVKYASKCIVTP